MNNGRGGRAPAKGGWGAEADDRPSKTFATGPPNGAEDAEDRRAARELFVNRMPCQPLAGPLCVLCLAAPDRFYSATVSP